MNLYENYKNYKNEKIIEKIDKCFMNDDFFNRLDENIKHNETNNETNVDTTIPARLSRLLDFAHDNYMHGVFVGMVVAAEIEAKKFDV